MRELIERLFGKKEEGDNLTDGQDAASTAPLPGLAVPEEPALDAETENAMDVERSNPIEHTIIVSSDEVDEEVLQVTGNVFEDTLPGKAVLEETAVGLSSEPPVLTATRSAGLSAAQCCHIGNVRERNEDSSFMFTAEFGGQEPLPTAGLYIVADGMGGHHAGHEASRNAARVVAKHILDRIYIPLLHNSTGSGGHPQEPIGEVMVDAVQAANHFVHDNDPKKSSGTTLTAALILGKRLYVAHVGDSRAYMFSDGELNLLTTDHSYVRRLQEAGQLTEEEAAVHPQRNMLYRAVGQGGDLDVETFTRTLPRVGKLVLCSDGLWGLVSNETIAEVIDRDIPLAAMTDELVAMARIAGGHDNITVIVVAFSF